MDSIGFNDLFYQFFKTKYKIEKKTQPGGLDIKKKNNQPTHLDLS
jgi:hypothetical protein